MNILGLLWSKLIFSTPITESEIVLATTNTVSNELETDDKRTVDKHDDGDIADTDSFQNDDYEDDSDMSSESNCDGAVNVKTKDED